MKKSNFMPAIVLGCICLVAALLLSVVNKFTAPIIAKLQSEAASGAFAEVLPGASGQEDITLDETFPKEITAGYKFDNGYIFQMEVTGKNSGLIIICGIDLEGKITGTKVIADQETDSYDAKVFPFVEGTAGAYTDMTLDTFDPYLVSGATLTSEAFSKAVKAALQAFAIVKGEVVDTRTPEEIFQDNCNAALGTTGKTFLNVFLTAQLEGVDGVYAAEGTEGNVYVIGESFVGVKNGAVTTADASTENKAIALAADTKLNTVTFEDVDVPEGFEAKIVSIQLTSNGDYVIEAYGDGYGIKGGNKYHPASGKQIVVKICISATGAIIDSVTTFEEETPDFGGKLLKDPAFYEAYEGKTQADYNSVPNASGATLTSKGYKDALKKAFEVFELLTEGGND